jgi:hypothetical protein
MEILAGFCFFTFAHVFALKPTRNWLFLSLHIMARSRAAGHEEQAAIVFTLATGHRNLHLSHFDTPNNHQQWRDRELCYSAVKGVGS